MQHKVAIGIVGSEAAKFTQETARRARRTIRELFVAYGADTVVSGGCHLGGIDEWAAEEGRNAGLAVVEHLPATLSWLGGYKPRNIKIAEDANPVICLTVRELPAEYSGMRFEYCYHCNTRDHVKSGGCWTVKYAKSIGKEGGVIVI